MSNEPETYAETGSRLAHEADDYLRQNPIPTVLGALAIGFAIGLLVRGGESTPKSKLEALQDQLEESQDDLRTLLSNLSKTGKKKYKQSADAVRSGVSDAVDAVQDIDVDDYLEPASKWFRKLWKKYV